MPGKKSKSPSKKGRKSLSKYQKAMKSPKMKADFKKSSTKNYARFVSKNYKK